MDSTHGLMHACSQTRPGPAAQTARPGQTGSTPRTLPGTALFPPECRVTEPLSNWKTSSGPAEQGRCLLLYYDYCRLPPRHACMLGTVRYYVDHQWPASPLNPVNRSARYSSSLLSRTDTRKTSLQGSRTQSPKSDARTKPTWTRLNLNWLPRCDGNKSSLVDLVCTRIPGLRTYYPVSTSQLDRQAS